MRVAKSFSLSVETAAELVRRAKAEGVPVSHLLERILKERFKDVRRND